MPSYPASARFAEDTLCASMTLPMVFTLISCVTWKSSEDLNCRRPEKRRDGLPCSYRQLLPTREVPDLSKPSWRVLVHESATARKDGMAP